MVGELRQSGNVPWESEICTLPLPSWHSGSNQMSFKRKSLSLEPIVEVL